jgi:UDPglucose 6-dehydrogenase
MVVLSKDVQALIKTASEHNYELREYSRQKLLIMIKISALLNMKYFKGDVKGKTIALWGLSFKTTNR